MLLYGVRLIRMLDCIPAIRCLVAERQRQRSLLIERPARASRVPDVWGFGALLTGNGHRWFSSEVFEATDEENQTDGREP